MKKIRGCNGMKQSISKLLPLFSFMMILYLMMNSVTVYAQSTNTDKDSFNQIWSQPLTGVIILLFILLCLYALIKSDALNKLGFKNKKAHKTGNDQSKPISIKRGFDIKIQGKSNYNIHHSFHAKTYAVKPPDFLGMSPIPKCTFEIGDKVLAGSPLFFDKKRPDIIFSAPVSGEIIELKRGEKRKIEEIIIQGDDKIQYKNFGSAKPKDLSRDEIKQKLIDSGVWTLIRQRPFDIIPDIDVIPDFIYVSTFDTAPLAPDYNFLLKDHKEAFLNGVEVLKKLSEGKVHFGMNASLAPVDLFKNIPGIQYHWFKGPHPAGNIGIQMHHVSPVNKDRHAWYINPQDILIVGKLFLTGHFDASRTVALAGPEVITPQYYKTYIGAHVENMLKDNTTDEHIRVISGNVLTGSTIDSKGYLGYYDHLLSVIKEGDFYESFGWLIPQYAKPSISPSFLSHFNKKKTYQVNTNSHGEKRAFVLTGLYEKVLPMDIYPMQLLKAIITEDFEKIEKLGIYEVSKEDFALCEYVDPSKNPIQEIIGSGLELVREQG